MKPTPYRRGNLREALLSRAVAVLEERGSAALSLRELARDVGVSHAAPARHFADRTHLLEALAVEGFRILEVQLRASADAGESVIDQAGRMARTYLTFTIEKASLVEVMFRHESGMNREAIGVSAAAAFEPLLTMFRRAQESGSLRDGDDATATATSFLATLQGTAALVNCGVVEEEAAYDLVEDAVTRYLHEPVPS
ncbi:TetR/AcrR family transcriptional regulator [Microbacterium sp. CIAB417]|uniref:TetR/AcrR family transcriptional regulator n=1 Tax=Microbacterium sp. CIAB417 TaxID=2860287 RepID=UPI001FABE987|nr:TetR/AcrR family transcriptional regulator [Microbacterium sp. CIAB417]